MDNFPNPELNLPANEDRSTGVLLDAEKLARVLEEKMTQRVDRAIEEIREKMEENEEARNSFERRVEEWLKSLEEITQKKVDALKREVEGNLNTLQESAQSPSSEDRAATAQLEGRMEALEVSLGKALSSMMPRVEALVQQLERRPSPEGSSASNTFPLPPDHYGSSSSLTCPADPPSPVTSRRLGTELLKAAEEGRAEVVRYLLARAAPVNHCDHCQYTPLHWASAKGHADVVALLLRGGADATAKNMDGSTALHLASWNDPTACCVSLLLGAGALVDSRNSRGWTPLHRAANWGNEAAVHALLVAGADRAARDEDLDTPLDVARSNAVRRLLRS